MSTPTTTSLLLAVAIGAGTLGYWIGVGYSLPWTISRSKSPKLSSSTKPTSSKSENSGSDVELSDSDYESEEEAALVKEGKIGTLKAGMNEECKLVLVVNQELGMQKGKIAAQCCHATLMCYKTMQQQNPRLLKKWEQWGQAKVALKATSTEHLLDLQKQATALGLCARAVQDAGRTQVKPGSRTVLGIGPGPVKLIDKITGGLKLL